MKSLTYALLFVLAPLCLFAQDETVFFHVTTPKPRPQKSLYSTITFLDSRQDSIIGILNVGSREKLTRLVLLQPVEPELTDVLGAYIDNTAGSGQLLFQLRRFSFAEYEKSRYCYFTATVYARAGDRYVRLADLDTAVLVVTSNVETIVGKACNRILDNFIAQTIALPAVDPTTYSRADLDHIDSLGKRHIPVYNTTTYIDGLYGDYKAFMQQTPDLKGEIRTKKDGSISSLNIHDPRWRNETKRHIFAVVYKGIPYAVTHYGYYPMENRQDNFYFTGDLSISATENGQVAADLAFGSIIGSAIAGDKATYEVMIDYENGQFLHQKVLREK